MATRKWSQGVMDRTLRRCHDAPQDRRRPVHDPIATSRLHRVNGFTIIELLVVMSIIVVLSTIGMVQYRNSVTRSKEAVLREDLFRMRDAIDQFYADKNAYPASLQDLVAEGYIRAVPKDPFTESDTSWLEVPSEPDPANPIATTGVYDVKSGSDQTALDGTQYADW